MEGLISSPLQAPELGPSHPRGHGLCAAGGSGWPGARPGEGHGGAGWREGRDRSGEPGGGGRAGARGAGADWQVREWVGKAGAGPGAAGGCGPASPPPPRDYLVPAAAMSPGRNVPPQIMLFISLGGSAARQHQAPGGRCARSPALPSSPCAAAATAAPGFRVVAASAPAQVSPGKARRPEGSGCRFASAEERRGPRGAGGEPRLGRRA